MSVASSSSTPPPTQSPLTAATIGLGYESYLSRAWLTTRAVSAEALKSPLMSAPAQKARVPAPVSTMARHGPRSSSSHWRARSAIIARVIALRRGRLSTVTTTTYGPCASVRISIASGSRGHDHDLAERLAVGQELDRLHRPLERQAVADQRLEPPLAIPGEQRLDRAAELVRGLVAVVAQRAAEGGAILDQEPVGRDLLDAAHEAHQQHAAAPAERGERGVGQLAADRIEADVRAPIGGQGHDPLGEVLGGVVHEVVGAVRPGHRELLRGAGPRNHPRAHRLADLHRGEAHASRRAQHQQG